MARFFPFTKARCQPPKRRARWLLRSAFYGSCIVIAALSLAPSSALPPTSFSDKLEHVIAYAVLGFLGAVSDPRGHSVAVAWRTVLGLALFGIAIEALQSLSPGRSPDGFDAVADVIGAAAGGGAAFVLSRLTRLFVDKGAGHETPCRPRAAGGGTP